MRSIWIPIAVVILFALLKGIFKLAMHVAAQKQEWESAGSAGNTSSSQSSQRRVRTLEDISVASPGFVVIDDTSGEEEKSPQKQKKACSPIAVSQQTEPPDVETSEPNQWGIFLREHGAESLAITEILPRNSRKSWRTQS